MIANDQLAHFRKLLFRMSRDKIFYSFFQLKNISEEKQPRSTNWDSLEEVMESPLECLIHNPQHPNDSAKSLLCQKILDNILSECQGKWGFIAVLPKPVRQFFQPKLEQLMDSFDVLSFDFPSSGDQMNSQISATREEVSCCLRILGDSIISLEKSSLSLESPPLLLPGQPIASFQVLKCELLSAQFYLANLNLFVQNRSLLHGLFWVAEDEVDSLTESVAQFNQRQEASILKLNEESPSCLGLTPPTSFTSSNFFAQFQEIVNTYGVPKYREINPAVFTAVTFPFLFGLMFGDIAHGFILFCFALVLFCKSQSLSVSLGTTFSTMRSLAITLLFMGFFSVYVGCIYNDFLALPITLYPSCYQQNGTEYGKTSIPEPSLKSRSSSNPSEEFRGLPVDLQHRLRLA